MMPETWEAEARHAVRVSLKILAILALITLALLVLFIASTDAQADPAPFDFRIFPGDVDRHETFRLEMFAGRPNLTFNVQITGRSGFFWDTPAVTDADGNWRADFIAWYDFGVYEIRATGPDVNDTKVVVLKVGCDIRCQIELLNGWGLSGVRAQVDVATRYAIIAILVLVALELPRSVVFFARQARDARKHGRLTAKDMAFAPIAFARGFVQPGSQSVRPDVGAAIALDLERRELMEQLHDATATRFMGWRPDHVDAIEAVFTDLKAAWRREAQAQVPPPPPWQPTYERKPIDRTAIDARLQEAKEKSVMDKMDEFNDEVGRVRAGGAYMRAWLIFGLIGIPAGAIAVLVTAAYAGVYVDALRPLWVPWPPDWLKLIAGWSIFAVATARLTAAYWVKIAIAGK